MGAGEVLAAMAAVVAGCMIALWLLSRPLRDASIADIFRDPTYREPTRAFFPRPPAPV